jgi:aminoglycoside 3-N-acetyltransferase
MTTPKPAGKAFSMDSNATAPAHTRETLRRDLSALGVETGDTLFVHASFKRLGPVQGGADAVIGALEDALGHGGLLLMPAFNLSEKGNAARAAVWDIGSSPSTVGWLTEYFRTMPGTFRSDHFSHSVAARGRNADEFVTGHRSKDGLRSPWDLAPWGQTYGTHSPMMKAYERPRGKILMLGVDYHSSTYCHLVEVLYWNHRLERDAKAEYYWLDRPKIGAHWDEIGHLSRGRVGSAESRLFRIRDFVDALLDAVEREPGRWFKGYPSASSQTPGG